MELHMDSWPWKIAIVLALVSMRWFVHLLSPKEVSGRNEDKGQWLIETLDSAVIAIGLVLFVIQPFLLQAFYIPSGSMEDTLRFQPVGDRLLVSKLIYRLRDPRFQDVVVFRAPPAAIHSVEETDFIKRCIGTPGDIMVVRERKLYRNGKRVEEPYMKWSTDPNLSYAYDMKIVDGVVYSREYSEPGVPGPWRVNNVAAPGSEQKRIEAAAPGRVPADKFLMLGDHRNNSNDSHVWGFVPRANIVGKAVCVFWPPTRVSLIDRLSFHPRRSQSPAPGDLSLSTP
ncbi:MAG TPA: signal peptidase I [Abditibacteriaceae bacterium]|nr:signal peptidase I [Abditibacteriaceae bacterium]